VVIEGATYDGVEAPLEGEVVLPPGTKSLELRYTALSFTAPEKVRFRHRLEGFDADWIDAGTRRFTRYTHLAPGVYRFHVLAANDDGLWNETGASYGFTVEPHFYQTTWFYAACIVVVVAAGWSIHRLRLRQTEARYAAVVAERGRIARELHDTIAQGFAGVSMQLEAVAARLPESPTEARENLDRARLLIRSSLADARRTVRDLRPQLLESGDLAASLAAAASAITASGGIRVDVDVRGARRKLPPGVEDQLFRVGQEALANAVRHGKPRAVNIRVTYDRRGVELVVEDDGIGWSGAPPPARDGGGLGLVGMRERMEQIGGHLEITSESGRGTRVRAVARLGESGTPGA
jgi:signal transduction histidine kinase